MAKNLREEIEDRLYLLRLNHKSDGADAGMIDIFSYHAAKEVSEITGMKTLPTELIFSVADIAAAELAASILAREDLPAVSGRTDGGLSVHYIKGTTEYERVSAAIEKMRARGIDGAKKYRRIRW